MGNGAKIWRSKEAWGRGGEGAEARGRRRGSAEAKEQRRREARRGRKGEDGKGLRIPAESGAKKSAAAVAAARARDSVGIRTLDPQIRNLLLYPAELRNRPYGIPVWPGSMKLSKLTKSGAQS